LIATAVLLGTGKINLGVAMLSEGDAPYGQWIPQEE